MKSVSWLKQPVFLSAIVVISALGWMMAKTTAQTVPPPQNESEQIVDTVAAKTITKFNGMSCQQLATSLSPQPPQDPTSMKDQIMAKFITALKQNPALKTRYFNQVSSPILTKMFDCGMIPK